MTHLLLWLGMAASLSAFAGLLLAGRRLRKRRLEEAPTELSAGWPPLSLIVPVAGSSPGLGPRLASLLRQDYPDYEVLFAVRDPADPAVPVLRSLLRKTARARLVVAGPARSCGQKNHNLLAGVRLARRESEILAFCDSNQEAPPDFLRKLAAPLVRGEGVVTSGYHHILPLDQGLATLGRTVTVLVLYLTKAVPPLNQPWGGATAICRRTFSTLGVERLWAETVVDDVSLAALLARRHLPVCLSLGADLLTPLGRETLASWRSWLFRQWIYLKYYFPGPWLAAGLFLYGTAFLTAAGLVSVPLSLGGFDPPLAFGPALLFLGGQTMLALGLRRLHPHPPGACRWLAACLAALGMAVWVHFQTCLTQKITWRNLTYEVDWRGRVRGIRMAPPSP